VLLSARANAIGLGAVRGTPDGDHDDDGLTVDAVLGFRCDGGASADPLSGYDRQDDDPCAG
jgi:hypothetical protein